ncbi:MAG: hypothetical protein U0941_16265 [Planctomycetaceae bacterium]
MTELRTTLPDATKKRLIFVAHPLFQIAIAFGAGASLFVLRRALRGSADPFTDGWPVYLQLGALSLTFLLACINGQPFLTAMGIYCGFIGYLLADGGSEYPVASVIALTVHGLLPALAVACIVFGMQRWQLFMTKRGA